MINTLLFVFITIQAGQIGFLTSDFIHSKLICQKGNMTYQAEKDGMWTYHEYKLPEGEWNCIVAGWGEGLIYPSQYDFVSKELKL